MKNKNLILLLLALILFCYAFVIGIMPLIINDSLKNKKIIPELERLTQLKIDYAGAKVSVSPALKVTFIVNNIKADKKDVDQKVASANAIKMELGPMALFSKHYNIKSMEIKGATYNEVIDNGTPEIVTFLEKYSLLSVAGSDYHITVSPITVNFLLKQSYNVQSGEYSEKTYDIINIDAASFEQFINVISQGKIHLKH